MSLHKKLKLMFVAGSVNCPQGIEETLMSAIKGGITSFQWREKTSESTLKENERIELGMRLKDLCRQNDILFIVNDDVQLAAQLEADGVHLGQEDMSLTKARKLLPVGTIIGQSTHNVEEALDAEYEGADYIGVGPMFFTQTKKDLHPVIGPSLIMDMRRAGIKVPIVGIGGIHAERVTPVVKAGADGVAVIHAIASSELGAEEGAVQIYKQLASWYEMA
ncbi:thiamine phosphate synthase [Paenibacillus agilis]|nr:thiamine phosphate synthase [Paenibacillus agilis]